MKHIHQKHSLDAYQKLAAFKSKAQRRKFYALLDEGKISKKVLDEWEADTPASIPERLLTKTAGGPGSGIKAANTKKFKMPLSPYITIMKRKEFMEKNTPYIKKMNIEMSDITHVGQEKYVPLKVQKFLDAIKDKNNTFNPLSKPIDVTLMPGGKYAVLDGHHRFLVAKILGRSFIKANVYRVGKEDKRMVGLQSMKKVAMQHMPHRSLLHYSYNPHYYSLEKQAFVGKALKRFGSWVLPKLQTAGKTIADFTIGSKTINGKWDPMYGLKSIGRGREVYKTGPLRGMYKYDDAGEHIIDFSKPARWDNIKRALSDEWAGASRTRADLAAKQLAKSKDISVGQLLKNPTPQTQKYLQRINNMKATEFMRKYPGLAANYYGRNALHKGMVSAFPAMAVHGAVTGANDDPTSSRTANVISGLTEAAAWPLLGPAGIVGGLTGVGAITSGVKALGNTISPPKKQQQQRVRQQYPNDLNNMVRERLHMQQQPQQQQRYR